MYAEHLPRLAPQFVARAAGRYRRVSAFGVRAVSAPRLSSQNLMFRAAPKRSRPRARYAHSGIAERARTRNT